MPSMNTIAVASILAIGALARPSTVELRDNSQYCLDKNAAQQVATNYGNLIAGYTDELAVAALSVDFTDFSASVNSLIVGCPQGSAADKAAAAGLPLLAASFTNRTQFQEGQGQQDPINFFQLNMWHSCDTVIIRWETTNTANITTVRPVVGLIALETVEAPAGNKYPYYISTVYSEFDSGSWIKNIQEAGFCGSTSGETCTAPASAAPTASPSSTPNNGIPIASMTGAPTSTAGWPASSPAAGSSSASVWKSTIVAGGPSASTAPSGSSSASMWKSTIVAGGPSASTAASESSASVWKSTIIAGGPSASTASPSSSSGAWQDPVAAWSSTASSAWSAAAPSSTSAAAWNDPVAAWSSTAYASASTSTAS
ncbi:hypothetical protein LTR56_022434 [Elasticomyces elasticus]|nr:hypothetical protein LTR22_027188 [Elasticomyces elasticus]KAK3621998.1 hypothetical protein LTR56_022434 [Elasticomyces elasticus]KAK4904904.1 hypothetical protein LTR49_025720 [Elasticomyces elasticus]KAK5723402.1 hypothetical protein LTR15_005100 [Elasticomyces elasticus]KAK5749101.1 hypothetical protein LTS12_020863 [Elasticomyces elasticus]